MLYSVTQQFRRRVVTRHQNPFSLTSYMSSCGKQFCPVPLVVMTMLSVMVLTSHTPMAVMMPVPMVTVVMESVMTMVVMLTMLTVMVLTRHLSTPCVIWTGLYT